MSYLSNHPRESSLTTATSNTRTGGGGTRSRGANVAQQSPGAQTRRYKTKIPGNKLEPAQYSLRTDLATFLWQKDNAVDHCPNCNRQFGFFLRMHHCRACGLIYCDKDCPEDDDHDQDRVCTNCKQALAELNHLTKVQFDMRIRQQKDARIALDELGTFEEVNRVRDLVIGEEDRERLILISDMKTALINMAKNIKNEIFNVVGNVEIEKRRSKPIYGCRSGVLRLRVRRAKNLPAVKPSMNCVPHVIVQVGADRQCTQPIMTTSTCIAETKADAAENKIRLGGGQAGLNNTCSGDDEKNNTKKCSRYFLPASHDFMFDELFVFDVQNDKDGVIVAFVDDITMHPIPIMLGMIHINIRKMDLVEEEVDWNLFDIYNKEPPTLMSAATSCYQQQQQQNSQAPAQHQNTSVNNNSKEEKNNGYACAASLLLPGGENIKGVNLASAYCSLILPPPPGSSLYNNPAENSTTSHPSNNSMAPNELKNFAKSRIDLQSMSSACPVMHGKTKKDFLNYIERGNSNNMPLHDYLGNPLTSAQASISWTFHPYRMTAREQQLASANSECRVCHQKDTPNDCLCADEEKERADEEYVRGKMRAFGKEVHIQELHQRDKTGRGFNRKEKETTCCGFGCF